MKQYRNPLSVHEPLAGYAHQVEIVGPERVLVLSGQVGRCQDGTVPDDPIEQLDIALENVQRNLQAANMDMSDVFKITFYLVGETDAGRRREVLEAMLLGHQPCMTLLFVVALASPIYRVEVDVWASRDA
jgi:2-iminobutanoate/2-iminopropanoate deaminase